MRIFLMFFLSLTIAFSLSCQRVDKPEVLTEKEVPELAVQRSEKKGPFVKGVITLSEGIVPTGLAVSEDGIYVNDLEKGVIALFDMEGKAKGEIKVPGPLPSAIDVHKKIIYYGDIAMENVHRIKTDGKGALEPLPFYGVWQKDIAVTDDEMIFLDTRKKEIVRTDKYDGSTIDKFKAPGKNPTSITYDGWWLYCAESEEKKIHVIEPQTGWVIRSIPSPATQHLSGLSFYKGDLYAGDLHDNKIHILSTLPDKPLVESEKRNFRVIFRLTNQIEGAGSAKNLRNYIAIPKDRPGQKLLSKISFSPEPDGFVTDRWGQKLAEFKTANLNPGDIEKITMTVDVKVSNAAFHFDPLKTDNISAKGFEDYLGDGRKYTTSNGYIAEKAKEIIGDEKRYYHKARKIYEHLADSITYEREGGWGRAETVIKRGTGSCSEYTFALLALYRTVGIPSRYVGAFVNRSEHGGLDFVFHRWAEIWMGEKYGWIPVDANAGASKEPEKRGDAFGSIPNRYLVTTISGGESEYLDWSYNYGVKYDSENGGVVKTFPLARWVPLENESE